MDKKLPAKIYYVTSSQDQTVLLALEVKIRDNLIQWFDTVKDRMMKIGKIIVEDDSRFVFERSANEGGGNYIFVPLTLEIYREKVKNRLLAGRDFNNDEELFSALEQTKHNAW